MLINKNIFNVSEAAFILGLSASTIYKFIHTGVIKAFKYDNRYAWYITADELHRYDLLKISPTAAYRLLASGKLKCFHLGRIWRIPRECVNVYIREQSFPAT